MEPSTALFVDPSLRSAPVSRRKLGRPKGSKGKVLHEVRALGVHHFAFVRSSLLGLDLAEAFDRYLAWSEATTDLRYVQNRRDALLKHIIEAGRYELRCHLARLDQSCDRLLEAQSGQMLRPKAVAENAVLTLAVSRFCLPGLLRTKNIHTKPLAINLGVYIIESW